MSIAAGIDIIRVQLPDAMRDSEAMLVDPLTRDIYLFSKREAVNDVYRIAYPPMAGKDALNTAPLAAAVSISMIVGADMSAEGKETIIKNYGRVYYWNRRKNESAAAMFAKAGAPMAYTHQNQEEAIAFDRESLGCYTLGEAAVDDTQNPPVIAMPPLMFYRRK